MDDKGKLYIIHENIYKKPALKWNIETENSSFFYLIKI